jgi:hypothetical protein
MLHDVFTHQSPVGKEVVRPSLHATRRLWTASTERRVVQAADCLVFMGVFVFVRMAMLV